MKKFSEIKKGDKVYFLFDTYNILQECGNSSMGFANSNYGLVICSRTVTSESWRWHSPRTEEGLLFELTIDSPVYDYNEEKVIFSMKSIRKKEGYEHCIRIGASDGYYSYPGYIFTTKEALGKKVRQITDKVESNLKKINNAIAAL